MPSASLQLNQLLSDGKLAGAKKAGKKTDGLIGGEPGAMAQGDVFRALLGGLAKVRRGKSAADILGASATTTTTGKKSALAQLDLSKLHLTPELAAALKNITAEDLKSLPPEVAALFAQHMTAEGKLDEKVTGILDALSTPATQTIGGEEAKPELFTIINDPKLAEFLAGLAAAFAPVQDTPVAPPAADTKTFASFLPTTGFAAGVAIDAAGIKSVSSNTVQLSDGRTITITSADMSDDAFKNLKKLAFADIAPFLTMPRTVRIDNNTVIKIAQGPAFLNDGNSSDTVISQLAGLASVLPAGAFVNTKAAATATDSAAPIFLDASVLTRATASLTPQAALAKQNAAAIAASPQQTVFNRAQLFAALLGAPVAPAQTDPAVSAQGQTAINAKTPDGTIIAQPTTVATGPLLNAATGAMVAAPQAATAAAVVQAVANALRGGEAPVLKGLDTSIAKIDGDDFFTGLDGALNIHADQTVPLNSSTTLISARTAGAPHPASYMVSVALQKNAEGIVGERQFTIQLDPPNLGRVKITLDIGDNNTIKAKIMAERPETVALLQKDSHLLERALQNSGLNANASSFTFDLAQNGSFSGGSGYQGGAEHQGKQGSNDDGTDIATIETLMPIFVDPTTGLTHVNLVI